ncbi:MAG: hypothetical protein QNI84_07960 [Henriciella sp.]|nr:hypothetical protein [Henriciella sp.]
MSTLAAIAVDASFEAFGVAAWFDPDGAASPCKLLWIGEEMLIGGFGGGETIMPDGRRAELRRSEVPQLLDGALIEVGEVLGSGARYTVLDDPASDDADRLVWSIRLRKLT